jgi:hypothetical protein
VLSVKITVFHRTLLLGVVEMAAPCVYKPQVLTERADGIACHTALRSQRERDRASEARNRPSWLTRLFAQR